MTTPSANNPPSTDKSISSSGQKDALQVNLERESVAGEEDPGASLDISFRNSASASDATPDASASKPLKPLKPGD